MGPAKASTDGTDESRWRGIDHVQLAVPGAIRRHLELVEAAPVEERS